MLHKYRAHNNIVIYKRSSRRGIHSEFLIRESRIIMASDNSFSVNPDGGGAGKLPQHILIRCTHI